MRTSTSIFVKSRHCSIHASAHLLYLSRSEGGTQQRWLQDERVADDSFCTAQYYIHKVPEKEATLRSASGKGKHFDGVLFEVERDTSSPMDVDEVTWRWKGGNSKGKGKDKGKHSNGKGKGKDKDKDGKGKGKRDSECWWCGKRGHTQRDCLEKQA